MEDLTYTTFAGDRLVATGDLSATLTALKREFERDASASLVTIVDQTGRQVDFDLRGSLDEALERHGVSQRKPGPGRPRLGVVSREVSLLPRQWDWLADQPGGASGTLRRLVDQAAESETAAVRTRRQAAATGRAMTILAGNLENFEEAYRALERRDEPRFASLIGGWPSDVRDYLTRLARAVFGSDGAGA